MKLREALNIVEKVITNFVGNNMEFDTFLLEGHSGVGKTSGLLQTIKETLKKVLESEGVQLSDAEIDKRILFINMGGGEDSTRFLGMPVPIDGELHMLKPKEFETLIKSNEFKILILDELNRVDQMTANAVQPYLGAADRAALGIKNTLVFATQNPATDEFIGAQLQDKALSLRTVNLIIDNPTLEDIVQLGDERDWAPEILDALEYTVEEDSKVDQRDLPAPRLLEKLSNLIKIGVVDAQLFQSVLPDHAAFAALVIRACNDDLLKTMTLEELKEAAEAEQLNRVSEIIINFRKIVNSIPKGSKGNAVWDKLGEILLLINPSFMAAVHRRFFHKPQAAFAWSKNRDLKEKIKEVTCLNS